MSSTYLAPKCRIATSLRMIYDPFEFAAGNVLIFQAVRFR